MGQAAKRGRPQGSLTKPVQERLRRALATKNWVELDKIIDRWIKDAVDGDPVARAQICDRLDGKPAQSLEAQVDTNVTLNVYWPE